MNIAERLDYIYEKNLLHTKLLVIIYKSTDINIMPRSCIIMLRANLHGWREISASDEPRQNFPRELRDSLQIVSHG